MTNDILDQIELEKIEQLVNEFQKSNVVLFAGSGCNNILYGDWRKLTIELVNEFKLSINVDDIANSDGNVYGNILNKIKKTAIRNGKIEDYYNFLFNYFRPKDNMKIYDGFHLNLVSLPFLGYCTTNYDIVLESALNELQISTGNHVQSLSVDLCCENYLRRNIMEWQRNLKNRTINVLHLHGYYNNAKNMIVTLDDYLKYYEKDKLHKSTISNIATSYTLLFVGFSMHDSFIKDIIELVHNTYNLGSKTVHYIILFHKEKNNDKWLKNNGITPIYYKYDYSKLNDLIKILLYRTNSFQIAVLPEVNKITKKYL